MPPQRTGKLNPVQNERGPNKGQCPECGKDILRDLQRHRRTHLEKGVYPCTFPPCDKTFNQKQNRSTHINKWHLGTRPYACPHFWKDEGNVVSRCAATFDDNASLSRHRTAIHGHIPNGGDQTYEVKYRSRKEQQEDKAHYEEKIVKRKELLAAGRSDVSGAEAPRPQPSQDGTLAGSVASATSSSSSASLSSSSSQSRSSPPVRTRTHGSSSSRSSKSAHAQSSRASAPGYPAATSSSSTRTRSHAPSPQAASNMPRPARISPATSSNGHMSGANDTFGGAPYRTNPSNVPLSYGTGVPGSQYPPAMPFHQQDVYGQANALLPSQVPSQFFDVSVYGQYPPAQPAMGWGFQNPAFASYLDPMFNPDLDMGPILEKLVFDMPPVPSVGPYGSPGSWSSDYSRESSPESSSSSSPPRPGPRRGEMQDAYAYRYLSRR